MADTKISDLTALTGANVADDDEFVIVDTSAAQSKRITRAELANGGFTSLNVTGTITADGLTVDGVGTAIDLRSNNTSGTAQNALRFTDLDLSASANQQLGKIEFYSSDVSTPGAGVKAEISGVAEVGNPGAALIFKTDAQTGTPIDRVRINRFGDISFYDSTGTSQNLFWDASASRLGLGTTSPSQALHVVNSSTSYVLAETTGTGTSAGVRLKGDASADYTLFTTQGTNQFAIYDNAAGSERLRIDSSGNVGIGTTSPNNYSANHKSITLNAPTTPLIDLEVNGTRTGSFVANSTNVDLNAVTSVPIRFLTADTERMRIDSSGNLLVGKTSASGSTQGAELRADGRLLAVSTSDYAGYFNRKSTDGEIVRFVKDTTTVGSIGTYANFPTIGKTDTGVIFQDSNNAIHPWNISTNSANDGAIDLGLASHRFKDLYLSGLVRVGDANSLQLQKSGTTGYINMADTGNLIFRMGTGFSEKMRIDSSGNLLVGTTDTDPWNDTSGKGIALRSDGIIAAAASGTTALRVNRTSTDGNIAEFYKNGTSVGSIGVTAGGVDTYIGKGTTGLRFYDGSNADGGTGIIVPWNVTSNTARDAQMNLGSSTERFRNLYLSGGVYLGGTGSANKLDDYEEGTYTPTLSSGSSVFTYTSQVGVYTKIGRLIYVTFDITYSSFTSPNGSTTYIEMPAINATSTSVYHMAQLRSARCTALPTTVTAYDGAHAIIPGTNNFEINTNDGAGSSTTINSNNLNSSGRIVGSAIYST